MHHVSKRTRQVSSCSSCYTRKQKCDRRYPCNHCTRRRRPEDCVYNSPQAGLSQQPADLGPMQVVGNLPVSVVNHNANSSHQEFNISPGGSSVFDRGLDNEQPALLQSFGYFDSSGLNTMALLRALGSGEVASMAHQSNAVAPCTIEEMYRNIQQRMPPRPILDFLVQYFVSDVNWMKQLVHAPSFLLQYQQWWNNQETPVVADIEFAALVLRLGSYAAQFLPSASCTADNIHGIALPDIRDACSSLGDVLARTCVSLDWKGSLVRVQHILFRAMDYSCQGRADKCWEGIGIASRAAQKVGIHSNVAAGNDGVDHLAREVERRVFCSLYVLDSHVARQLDRVPFLPENIIEGLSPRMHLVRDVENMGTSDDAPEMFTERLMQLGLNRFWRGFESKRSSEYDPTQAEQRYEQFYEEYLSKLSPAFALSADTQWDKNLPKLAPQRQILRICIFDSICWNYRPVLLLKPSQVSGLPPYKQVLIRSQKKTIAIAALEELKAISALHAEFNNAPTRFALVIFNTFEAAVLLLCLCSEVHADVMVDDGQPGSHLLSSDSISSLTRDTLLQAADKALARLQLLADISHMAASGARVVEQLLTNLNKHTLNASVPGTSLPPSSDGSLSLATPFSNMNGVDYWATMEEEQNSDPNMMNELLSLMTDEEWLTHMEWPENGSNINPGFLDGVNSTI